MSIERAYIAMTKQLMLNESVDLDAKRNAWLGKSKFIDAAGKPMTFYHGTNADIEKFSHDYVGKGNDQFGSGFYFSNVPDVASGYATGHDSGTPNVLPVHLKVENPIDHADTKPLKRQHIEQLIKSSPDLEDSLTNYGDVDYEGMSKVLKRAVDAYTELPKFDAMVALHGDFYGGETPRFLQNFTKITGHDGVVHESKPGEYIVNVFHPHQIKSVYNTKFNPKSDLISESI